MKLKSIIISALTVSILIGCNKDEQSLASKVNYSRNLNDRFQITSYKVDGDNQLEDKRFKSVYFTFDVPKNNNSNVYVFDKENSPITYRRIYFENNDALSFGYSRNTNENTPLQYITKEFKYSSVWKKLNLNKRYFKINNSNNSSRKEDITILFEAIN